jgi:hypothetical protein
MMEMTVTVFDEQGMPHDIKDYMVFTKSMMWKVIQFSNCAGLLEVYQKGNLCSDTVIDARVKVKVEIEEGKLIPADKLKDKPLGSTYPSKNKIASYLKKDDKLAQQDNFVPDTGLDDDVPF